MLCHANWNECFREWKGPVFDYTGVISRCGLFQTDLVVWSPEFRGSTWTRPVWAEWTSGKAGKGAALCPQILLKGKVSLCPMPCEGFGLGIVLSCCSLKVEEDRGGRIPGNRTPASVTQVLGFLHTLPQENTFMAIPSPPYRGLPRRQATPCPLSWALRRYFDFPIEYFLWEVLPLPWKRSQS